LTIEREVQRDVLTFICRLEHNLLRGYLHDLVVKNGDIRKYAARQAVYYYVGKTNKACKTVFHKGLVLYNALPQKVKQGGSVGQFSEEGGRWKLILPSWNNDSFFGGCTSQIRSYLEVDNTHSKQAGCNCARPNVSVSHDTIELSKFLLCILSIKLIFVV